MKFILASLLATACLASPVPDVQAPTCGVPAIKPDTTTNIVGGKDAIPYSWPWQVALFVKPDSDEPYQFCAGSLITNQWVMTAGHCFYGHDKEPSKYQVKIGVFNKAKNNEPGEQVLGVSEIYINPKYDNMKTTYDITLLKLEKPVTFSDHISPICLPAQNETLPDDGSPVFVTGWGGTSEYGGDSATLKQVTVPLQSTANCKKAYPDKIFEDVMFCAGLDQGGKDSCQGDSGGPVVYQDPSTGVWKQVGITSWGKGCAEPKYYGVYSKVSAYITFIQKYIKDL